MPIYEYQCRKCEHAFELLVDGNEAAACPQCRAGELDRLLSLPAKPGQAASFNGACGAAAGVPPCGPVCSRWPSDN